MKVRDHFFITDADIDRLTQLALRGGYWEKAANLVMAVIDQDIRNISGAQEAWLTDILDKIQDTAPKPVGVGEVYGGS